jgi:hypothetical protein
MFVCSRRKTMSDTSHLTPQERDAAISTGLKKFSNLPDWLTSIKDHDRTYRVLSREIPEIADGRIILKKCRIGHVDYKEGVWQNRCTLKFRMHGEPAGKTIELSGILYPPESIPVDHPVVEGDFGTDGWHAIFPELNLELKTLEPETELVAFGLLTDPEKAREFLEHSLRGASLAYRNVQIQSCNPEIARYKPGDRCTILYHLEYAPDMPADVHAPPIVVAKTARQEKGRNAYEGMKALWDASFGSSNSVRIAEPIAYDPDLKVFVQGPVWEEQTLAELFLSALDDGSPEAIGAVSETMRQTAVGLADLHRSGVKIGQVVSWADEIAEVEAELTPLCAVFPDLISHAEPFLERVRQLEAATSPDPFVPSHGTFRPVQVLLNKEELSFIDFDSFCQSEPARDLSMFLTSMMGISLAPPASDKGKDPDHTIADSAYWESRFERVSSICDQFLDAYEQHHPVSRQRVALWEALNLFYFVVSGWKKAKTSEIPLLVRLIDRFLLESHLVDARDPSNG